MLAPGTSRPPANWLCRWPHNARLALGLGLAFWVIPMLVIGVIVALNPMSSTVSLGSYHPAAANWWARKSLYVGPQGMNYLPHFAILFTPFHLLPFWLAEVAWRFCMAATLVVGLWRLTRALFGAEAERPFLWATLVTMPLCMTSLRFGNANAVLGGVILLAVAATLERRWWWAAGWMALATAIKPLGIVLMLLAPLVYAPLRWRLAAAFLGLALFPFLFGSPAYVWSQHREAWTNLQACAVVTAHRFADINGLLRTFGTEFSPRASQAARVLAGALTAALFWLGARRRRGPLPGLWLYALATAYLMLFNPMNEENSYAILAPALGGWSAFLLFSPEAQPARWLGWACALIAWSMGFLPNALWPLFHNYFALFWHPFMTIVFVGLLGAFIWRTAPAAAPTPPPAA
jgi:hypothetical protein